MEMGFLTKFFLLLGLASFANAGIFDKSFLIRLEDLTNANKELTATNKELSETNKELNTTVIEQRSVMENLTTTMEDLKAANTELKATVETLNSTAAIHDATIQALTGKHYYYHVICVAIKLQH